MTDEPRPNDSTAATPEQGSEHTHEHGHEHTHEHEHGHEHEHAHEHETETGVATKEPTKLQQQVEIRDIGPCKKHIKVTIERGAIDDRLSEKFSELVTDSNVAGFRPGKAPRKIIERRFYRHVSDQVKTEVLLASLQQLAEEHDVAPLGSPDLDPTGIEMPREGPLVYEFEVEVRPQFDLPSYKGLKLRRPVHTFTPEEVEEEERRLLSPHGQIIPKPEGNAQLGDVIVADVVIQADGQEMNRLTEAQFRVNRQLAFKDGVARRFLEQIKGANAGDSRQVDIALSSTVANPALRGKDVQATFHIKDVKTVRLPELTHEFLHEFGVHSVDQLRELLQVLLQRRLEYQQRRAAREQVLEHISAAATWELPEDLLRRQAGKAMARRIMEMRADGISDEEIESRRRLLEQDILRSTELALKEHFVLQKIAEVEKIDITEDDINAEIERLADRTGESPRRVRARLEREDLLETLAAEMIERKALDLILDSAEYEDVPLEQEDESNVATVEAQTVPGEMHDPTAAPPTEGEAASSPPSP